MSCAEQGSRPVVDHLTVEQRSWNMGRIRSKNTAPERVVRQLLHRMGFRFRLHRADLPGRPDIVLPKYRTVIFVHGCFWHRHRGCKYSSTPKSHRAYWEEKFRLNRELNGKHRKKLRRLGWKVLVVWQCEVRDLSNLQVRLKRVLPRRAAETTAPRSVTRERLTAVGTSGWIRLGWFQGNKSEIQHFPCRDSRTPTPLAGERRSTACVHRVLSA